MNAILDIGFEEALKRAMENVFAVKQETLPVDRAVGRIVAKPLYARVDSPSVDASLKDGYAVVSTDLARAAPDNPVKLKISGHVAAGDPCGTTVAPGYAIRILSGAPIPEGADAVVADEFVELQDPHIRAFADAGPGRNILEKGADVFSGERLMDIGDRMRPQTAALVVAGGISEIPVFSRPTIGLLATGSEVLLPGSRLEEGKLYASNLALQHAWLTTEGFEVDFRLSGDSEKDIADAATALLSEADVLITSGGAWKGDHDLMVKVLDRLGWDMIFHRVRIGPGKAVGMGMLWGKPVFCLPGGPASNETSFMMIVFPAVLKMAGYLHTPYLQLYGRLERSVSGQADWTQFIQCDLSVDRSQIILHPKKMKSRLAAMAKSAAVVKIPEGVDTLLQGSEVPFICLDPKRFMKSIPG
ncbi:MAG: molybdopterin molybdotransferase MoeA [Desulfosalsimonadaceae bacterium]